MERRTLRPIRLPKRFLNGGLRRTRRQRTNAGLSHSVRRKIGAARSALTLKKLRAPRAATRAFILSPINTRQQGRAQRSKMPLRRNLVYPLRSLIELGYSIAYLNATAFQSRTRHSA